MKYGIDHIKGFRRIFSGKRIGLITNPSGVDSQFRQTAEILRETFGLAALFGPEHGVNGDLQAGVGAVDGVNAVLGVPEYSLYGKTPRLTPELLDKIDVAVFDIQDIGSRLYTYIYTLSDAMEECARYGVPLVVLDRPNPIGGIAREGTLLRHGFESFVGRFPIPVRHGLTAGEFALYINDTFRIGCDLTVVPCSGWRRESLFRGSWLNPSPNMPSLSCALVYNGCCFFEGTNLSEGRGTTRPYELVGAPFLDAAAVARRMNDCGLPGAVFRACCFVPTFSKHKEVLCHGIQTHVIDPERFNGFECGIRLFGAIRDMTPAFRCDNPVHLDQLFGDTALRLGTEPVSSIAERAQNECGAFAEKIRPFLLYGTGSRKIKS